MDYSSTTKSSCSPCVRIDRTFALHLKMSHFLIIIVYSFTKLRLEPSYHHNMMFLEDPEEDDDPCPFDAIYVYDQFDLDSNNSQGLGIFCGDFQENLPELKSKTNVMYVTFVTDSSRSNEGFAAAVSFTYGESTMLNFVYS